MLLYKKNMKMKNCVFEKFNVLKKKSLSIFFSTNSIIFFLFIFIFLFFALEKSWKIERKKSAR
jgi:hypothetical protein